VKAVRRVLPGLVFVALACAAGTYLLKRNPIGVFLYTPRNWCEGRMNSFALGWAIVLGFGLAAFLLLALVSLSVSLLARSGSNQEQSRALLRTLLASSGVMLVALLLTPLLEWSLPVARDPECTVQ